VPCTSQTMSQTKLATAVAYDNAPGSDSNGAASDSHGDHGDDVPVRRACERACPDLLAVTQKR
jgi:hypothetical protein